MQRTVGQRLSVSEQSVMQRTVKKLVKKTIKMTQNQQLGEDTRTAITELQKN